ncbi:hypothetical protein DL770_008230 [Monosporascus sp. CRB-9-2]|nr:hypothetical protein DL770_008230 [Monosporascus sp. CRB-9-2]
MHISPFISQYKCQIEKLLSLSATVQCGGEDTRWSEYAAPQPGAIITVGSEDDVAKIVAFANEKNTPFLVQSGTNGWADTFTLDSSGVIIDVSKLKAITFNSDKTEANSTAWTGPVVFDQSQLEQAIGVINEIDLEPEMQLLLYFAVSPPDNAPTVIVLPFYLGSEEAGRQKFAPILAVGPAADGTAVLPYNVWNGAGDAFCARGGRRPSYKAGLKTMDPATWRGVWDKYESFIERHPGEAGNATVLMERYSTEVALRRIDGSQSSTRSATSRAMPSPSRGTGTRPSMTRPTSSAGKPGATGPPRAGGQPGRHYSYINFAHGDEPLDHIYGSSLTRLQQLKRKYDPQKRSNRWFPYHKE